MTSQTPEGPSAAATKGLVAWHKLVQTRDPAGLQTLLADDVVFRSPVVHTPQRGRELTTMYLTGALHVLGNDTFRYERQMASGNDAALEFITTIDGIEVNGVDLIKFRDDATIIGFTVMLRPMKAIQLVAERMAAMLNVSG